MSTDRPNSAPPGHRKGRSTMAITGNDDKILGTITQKRREKSTAPTQYQSRNFKTYASNWTPMVHKPSNEQIYKERRDLISNWFDLWNDSQRKRFIDTILKQCRRTQLLFMQNWFQERIPLRHVDFTSFLPRFLSLYIFSYLDPRSLCRASAVCWHWKFICEQDLLWTPKCIKYGWFLPYSPNDGEYGAWKRHYIACTKTLHMVGPSSDTYRTPSDGVDKEFKSEKRPVATPRKKSEKKKPWMSTLQKSGPKFQRRLKGLYYNWENQKSRDIRREKVSLTKTRPEWQHPDVFPTDLTKANEAMKKEFNPNDPLVPASAQRNHNKWGQTKKHHRSKTDPDSYAGDTLSDKPRGRHRALTYDDHSELSENARHRTLSEHVQFENLTERRLMELVHQPWEPPFNRISRRQDLSGGTAAHPIPWDKRDNRNYLSMNYPSHSNPRVIFISSRVPAADLLHDAVMFGVIPIVFEYEGTSLDSLLDRLDNALQGRQAQSIGLFTHAEIPSEIRLVHGVTIHLENLDRPDIRNFFETIAMKIVPPGQGGQCHIFLPLAAYEAGMEMLVELNILTGMTFSSPTGIVGKYNNINTEWFMSANVLSPPSMYFVTSKLNVWTNTADQVLEGIKAVKRVLGTYLEDQHRDIVSQVTGQIMFDALGQADIQGVNSVAETLVDGMLRLSKQKHADPLAYLGKYLIKKAEGRADDIMETTDTQVPSLTSLLDDEDSEVALINNNNNISKVNTDEDEVTDDDKDSKTEKESKESSLKENTRTKGFKRLTIKEWDSLPEKRTPIAQEIYASEVCYVRHLELIRDYFVVPLRKAISSNQAVLGAANIQRIFSDVMDVLELAKILEQDLKQRIKGWSSHQCLGDVFLKFCGRLKCYTNFLNNYHVILDTIERSMEQNPQFRAFLKRHERTPDCKMLTIQELLLLPTRRFGEYVTLLSWFENHTPKDHPDSADILSAIQILSNMDDLIREMDTRAKREKELLAVQEKIVNCPSLLESNRYVIKQEDVSFLKPTQDDAVRPDLRLYLQTETLGLFLFNDALVFTRRTSKHFMFQRCVEYTYRFESSVGLTRLRVADIPDSKFVKNAFKMWTPKRKWICAAVDYDAKFNWITLLENTIKTAIDKN